jgi:hypothetical protein
MDDLLSPIESSDLTTHQRLVWNAVSDMIEEMPVDGINARGEFSPQLRLDQLAERKGARRARFVAYAALSEENVEKYIQRELGKEKSPARDMVWAAYVGLAMFVVISASFLAYMLGY